MSAPARCPACDGNGGGHNEPCPRSRSAAVLTMPEGFPDYVVCSCGNDPISSRGFYTCEPDGTMYDGNEYRPLIRCEDCGAMFDGAEIDAADGEAGATFQAVGMIQLHMTHTVGDFSGGWRAMCRCGWYSRTWYQDRERARAEGDRHLAAGNGQEVDR